jgi:hypothetical protein
MKVEFFWERPIKFDLIAKIIINSSEEKVDKNRLRLLWEWRFLNCPSKDKIYASYIMENNEVASFYAISPISFDINDTSFNGGLAVWGLTNPKFRGKGYYSELYKATQEKLINENINCLFAFDNHNSHYPEVKYLGWKDLGLLTEFSLQTTAIKHKLNHNSKYKVIFEELSEDIITKLSYMDVTKKKFSFQRGYEFLKWRLMDHPVNHYFTCNCYLCDKLLASAVLKSYQECEIDVMEIFFRNDSFQEYNTILNDIINFILGKGFKKINMWSNLNSEEHLMLEKIGFIECQFSAYFVYYPMNLLYDISNLKDWHYRFIDSDVF